MRMCPTGRGNDPVIFLYMPFYLQAIIAFLALFITDVCWAFYINKVKEGNAFHAAKWAVLLYSTSIVGTVSIVKDQWLLIPAIMGAFAGTFVAVKMDNRKLAKLKEA